MNFFKSSPLFLIILLFVNISCTDQNDNLTENKSLKGLWVDVKTSSDTLVFGYLDEEEIMTLNRGKEMQNGLLLPKANSGMYNYHLKENQISLRWVLSCAPTFDEFYFQKVGSELQIGNFYDDTAFRTKVTFRKIN